MPGPHIGSLPQIAREALERWYVRVERGYWTDEPPLRRLVQEVSLPQWRSRASALARAESLRAGDVAAAESLLPHILVEERFPESSFGSLIWSGSFSDIETSQTQSTSEENSKMLVEHMAIADADEGPEIVISGSFERNGVTISFVKTLRHASRALWCPTVPSPVAAMHAAQRAALDRIEGPLEFTPGVRP